MSLPVFQSNVFQHNAFQQTGAPAPPPPPPAPTITGFSPIAGDVGVVVTVLGTHFTGATVVSFGGVAATTFNVFSDTQLTAVVPTGAVTGPVRVTTPSGTGVSSSNFTVNTPPPPPPPPPPTFNLPTGMLADVGLGSFLFAGAPGSGFIITSGDVLDTTVIICEYTPSFSFLAVYGLDPIEIVYEPLSIQVHYEPFTIPVVYQPFRITGRYVVVEQTVTYEPEHITAHYVALRVTNFTAALRITNTGDALDEDSIYSPTIREDCISEPITLTIMYDPEFEEAGTV